MSEFLTELSIWFYLFTAILIAVLIALVAYNPKRAMQFVLRKEKKDQ